MPFCAFLLILCFAGPNQALALGAIATLLIGTRLLWRPGDTPILLFGFIFQWLQAAIAIFYANVLGIGVGELLSRYSSWAELATILSLCGLVVLALGMRLGAGPFRPWLTVSARHLALRRSEMTWLRIYAFCWIACSLAQVAAYAVPALSQPLLALAQLKWAAFVVLTISTFSSQERSKTVWLAVFTIELLLSFGGYFANFKDVFFFAFIGMAAAGVRLTAGKALISLACAVLLLGLSIVWTAIKTDYRTFVSLGESNQTVQVGIAEQWGKMQELVEDLNGQQLGEAAQTLLRRISYVEYFGAVIAYVPSLTPHQEGGLWLDAVSRPLLPRALFPDKPVLDDSEMTRTYTGLYVSGSDEGTSISIGYMGESYIDFGELGMMAPIFILGLLIGWLHRWLVDNHRTGSLIGIALAASIIVHSASRLETTAAKIFGGLVISFIVVWGLVNLVLPRLMAMVKK